MALFEFLSALDVTHFFLLVIIFILFVISMKKAFSIVINLIWAAGISLLFPVVMNKLFGFEIPMDLDTLVSFMLLGVGAYFVYLVASSVYKVLGIAGKFMQKVPKPKVSLPKGNGESKESRKELELREREMKLQEREMKLKEKESKKNDQQARWMSRVEESKGRRKKDSEDFVELKDSEDRPKKKNFAEPMKEIKHKKKEED